MLDIDVRDRDGTFEPQIVRKHQRRLGRVDDMVLSLSAKGLTTGEISAHLAEVYSASVSKDTTSAPIMMASQAGLEPSGRVVPEALVTG